MTEKDLARFLSKIDQRPNGCWVWTAATMSNGYARFRSDGRDCLAHRASFEYFVGLIPNDKEIDHLCRVRACVNPTHLEAVSHSTNVRRGMVPLVMSIVSKGNKYCVGRRLSPEAMERIAAANRGRKLPDETRAKISAALKGRVPYVMTPEIRAHIGAASVGRWLGRHHTLESKAKMAEARRLHWQRKKAP